MKSAPSPLWGKGHFYPQENQGIRLKNSRPCRMSVLDVEITILDKQSKGVPIDEQANDDVVHLDRFREADRLAN
jgi:hypothetical protein